MKTFSRQFHRGRRGVSASSARYCFIYEGILSLQELPLHNHTHTQTETDRQTSKDKPTDKCYTHLRTHARTHTPPLKASRQHLYNRIFEQLNTHIAHYTA